ncbi:unnamed protein product [Dovyalis caffra]|uniref:Uncharacterized protein n=1 Tax=Dovyalis caffra TaxID=77055 RepID=A0AAV1SHF0_9ROSI|nr:unnamed protein product [Dovyalis caffra]
MSKSHAISNESFFDIALDDAGPSPICTRLGYEMWDPMKTKSMFQHGSITPCQPHKRED